MNLDNFHAWLLARNYTLSTTQVTIGQVRHVHAAWDARDDAEPIASRQYALKRFQAFVADTKPNGALRKFARWLTAQGVSAATTVLRDKPKKRKYPATAFPTEEWQALCAAIAQADSNEALVLNVMATTGLRIGDILAVHVDTLKGALKAQVMPLRRKGGEFQNVPSGGALEEWRALYMAVVDADAESVAELVCPDNPSPLAGNAAYKRVWRALQKLAAEAGVESRIHPHRLRRTMAVMGLRATDNIVLVSQLLGHKSIATTQRYLDESHVDEVSNLQRKLKSKAKVGV